MKKLLVLVALLFLVTGCGKEEKNNNQTLPKVKTKMELICVGDFTEDLNGYGEMHQKVSMTFDGKGVKYLSGTVNVDIELKEDTIKDDNFMETFKEYLDEKICQDEESKYDTCEIEIDENRALITATGNKETITGFTGDEDIDLVKNAFEDGDYSCLVR